MVIFSAGLLPYFSSMVIDTEHKFSPVRVRTKDGKMRMIHPDHFPPVVTLENLPSKSAKVKKVSNWKYNTPDGWKNYEILTNEVKEKMDAIIENKSLTIEEVKKRTDICRLAGNLNSAGAGNVKLAGLMDEKGLL